MPWEKRIDSPSWDQVRVMTGFQGSGTGWLAGGKSHSLSELVCFVVNWEPRCLEVCGHI